MENILLGSFCAACGALAAFGLFFYYEYLPGYKKGYYAALSTARTRFRSSLYDADRTISELIEARALNAQADNKLREARRLVAQLPSYLQDLSK